ELISCLKASDRAAYPTLIRTSHSRLFWTSPSTLIRELYPNPIKNPNLIWQRRAKASTNTGQCVWGTKTGEGAMETGAGRGTTDEGIVEASIGKGTMGTIAVEAGAGKGAVGTGAGAVAVEVGADKSFVGAGAM
ncbi:unnamed protein product, partial [Ilex paraguariensis]